MVDTQKTKLLMAASAIFMALIGISASFLPQEILAYFNATISEFTVTAVKIIGALYLGLAFLNWVARGNIIGGIYSRPVALCNFTHFFIVAIILLQQWSISSHVGLFWTATIANVFFAASFAYILFFSGKASSS